MLMISKKNVLYKLIAEEISGSLDNVTAIIRCPFCGERHEHFNVSSGDLRFCPRSWGKKKYRVILPQGEIPIAWGRRAGDLTIIPRCPICQESHEHGRFAVGIMVAHCILDFRYEIVLPGGGK